MKRPTLLGLIAIVALVAAACGSGSSDASAGAGDGPTLTITSPSDGDEVTVPFTVEVSTSEELGPPDSGRNHWHLFFDGQEDEYTVESGDSAEIEDLSPGEHTIKVTLQHADHSPVGPEDEITVTVSGGSGDEDESESNDSGYGY